MDLGAYANIDILEEIAKRNNIEVPRLRGYRLMRDEDPIDIAKEIDKKRIAIDCVERLCTSKPFWTEHPEWCEYDSRTHFITDYYLVSSKDKKEYIDVRWDRIHGWKRKVLKTYIHNEIKCKRKQWEIWNKYVGKENVLYIHARIGGGNWIDYYKEVMYQPWFLEKVDDSFDSTYCDIYARITEI